MAYSPTIWKSKDKITKEKLNHLEQGVVDAHKLSEEVVIVHASATWDESSGQYSDVSADKSPQEIIELLNEDKNVVVVMKEQGQELCRWLNVAYSDKSHVEFTSQEIRDDENRYNVDSYTLEFSI